MIKQSDTRIFLLYIRTFHINILRIKTILITPIPIVHYDLLFCYTVNYVIITIDDKTKMMQGYLITQDDEISTTNNLHSFQARKLSHLFICN